MNTIITRAPYVNEIPMLQKIWRSGFGDNLDIKLFFDYYYSPELCVVACVNDSPAGAGYLIPLGDFVCDDKRIPCAYIYSIAVLTEYRGFGLGNAVVRELLDRGHTAGYPLIVLCPADDTLFEYYAARTELKEWFYICETIKQNPDNEPSSVSSLPTSASPLPTSFAPHQTSASPLPTSARLSSHAAAPEDSSAAHTFTSSLSYSDPRLSEITAEDYAALRAYLLNGTPHIEHDLRAIKYQQLLCKFYGGGLFKIELNGKECCATVEIESNNRIAIKELLAPDEQVSEALCALCTRFPSSKYTVRAPVQNITKKTSIRRFAMVAATNTDFLACGFSASPWFGPAFD